MAKRKKKSSKSSHAPSRSAKSNLSDISPPALREFEQTLAKLVGPAGSGFRFDDDDAQSPLDRAQALIDQAFEIRNPAKRIKLARQALDICPDCADAHMLLAGEQAQNLEDSIERFQQAVEAGKRAIGDGFEGDCGHFWGILETRPYMRARSALALTHWNFGERTRAIDHALDMLRLNPNDNQGVRYQLLTWLLSSNRMAEARKLWKQYEEDAAAAWTWSLALMEFVEHADSPQANAALEEAIAANPHLAALLLGREVLPAHPPEFVGFGDRDEAIAYVFDNLELWQQTDGALRWLSRAVSPPH